MSISNLTPPHHDWSEVSQALLTESLEKAPDSLEICQSIPEKSYRDRLSQESVAIGKLLKEAISDGWINREAIEHIQKTLLEKVQQNRRIELSKQLATPYFIYRYRALIAEANHYADAFCQAIIKGLDRFKMEKSEPFTTLI